ncbi:MAG: signal peptide peptidase SppA [Verrucomicrobiota bacterium]|nr:signal peptide peptidase SppA [Verrucomicrobiota bacterium]
MKSFFKDVFRRLAVTLVSALVFAVFSIALFAWFTSKVVDQSEAQVADESILVIDLTMNLTDRPDDFRLDDLTREILTDESQPPQFHLLEVLQALERAGKDKRIEAILLKGSFRPSGYGCGYQAIGELMRGFSRFQETGKKIVGYAHTPSKLDYLVYSLCDELHMDPSGTLLLNGLASEEIFLAETLEKYGVGLQVARVGEFKGAVEPFTATGFSEENRMQIRRLLDLRWTHYLQSVSRLRDLAFEELSQTLSSDFFLQPRQAEELGLVDALSTYGELIDRMSEIGEEDADDGFVRIGLMEYLTQNETLDKESPKVAVVYVEGAIVDGWADDGASIGGSRIADRIRKIRTDSDQYKALVLRVNSPGGSVSGSDAILAEISRARAEGLPVVVSMGSVAASGGYWISTDCDALFAGEQTITGSIGVFGLFPNFRELSGNFGLRWDVVKTHPSADALSFSRPKSAEEMKVLQRHVEGIYDRFVGLVAEGREMDESEVRRIAEGRVWMGSDAKERKLVDEFGGLEQAIAHAKELADSEEDLKIEEFPKIENPYDFLGDLMEVGARSLFADSVIEEPMEAAHLRNQLMETLSCLARMNDPRGVYGLLPGYRGCFGF